MWATVGIVVLGAACTSSGGSGASEPSTDACHYLTKKEAESLIGEAAKKATTHSSGSCAYVAAKSEPQALLPGVTIDLQRRRGPEPMPMSDSTMVAEQVQGIGAPAVWVRPDPPDPPGSASGGLLVVHPKGYSLQVSVIATGDDLATAKRAAGLVLGRL
jgi:hypothetical protein